MFTFVSDSVGNIVGQIARQITTVQDTVESPISTLLSTITQGAWEGEDADAMANEISSVVIPMVNDLLTAITGMSGGINQASDNVKNADTKALGIVEDLVGVFQGIF